MEAIVSRRRGSRVRWPLYTAALLALTVIGNSGGCDWFSDPSGANVAPDTWMTTCPGTGQVTAGEDVSLAWEGDDPDGTVVGFVWTYDDTTSGETPEVSVTINGVAAGNHRFEVAAVDDDGGVDPSPAECEFTASVAGHLVRPVVVAEFVTTLACVNCPNAEEALDIVLEEYGADSLVIVSYHDCTQIDPVATEETVARIHWYTDSTGVPEGQHPIVIFDGDHTRPVIGAESVSSAAADYRIEIDHRRTFERRLTVVVSGEIAAVRADITVKVRVEDALPAGDYVLRTVVIEDDVEASGHVFGFVARDILDDEPLAVSAVGDSAVVEMSFAVDPSWDVDDMDVIAFVQDDSTKEILQGGRLRGR